MNPQTLLLVTTAASVGVLHTILGPDHYLPFVAMARAGTWSRRKALTVTALCGVGHVAGSVVLGLIGIAFGLSLAGLESFESSRGSLAAWALIFFGLLYMIWGVRRGRRGHRHAHVHAHADGSMHLHEHDHEREHLHPHPEAEKKSITPWVLFVIFLLGPCEALIPLLMFPAATQSLPSLLLVTGTFGLATVATMLGAVFLGLEGVRRLPLQGLEPYAHSLAGLTILLCGVAIQFLGI
jgi:ABC-type nickel/cobalt efflux system permease component RcnA